MICDNCKKHIERKFLSKGKTRQSTYFSCERRIASGFIENDCSRDEICDYIYEIIQPDSSKREDLIEKIIPPITHSDQIKRYEEEMEYINIVGGINEDLLGCGTRNSEETH